MSKKHQQIFCYDPLKALRKERLLTVKAGFNVIRMLPPLILEMKHVEEAIEKIDKAFSEI